MTKWMILVILILAGISIIVFNEANYVLSPPQMTCAMPVIEGPSFSQVTTFIGLFIVVGGSSSYIYLLLKNKEEEKKEG